jgi:hypothetical protein
MDKVKLGIVGIGAMGSLHAQNILEGKVPRCELTAICDPTSEKLERFPSVPGFLDSDEFLSSSETDAVLIATPHYSHTTIGIAAKRSLLRRPGKLLEPTGSKSLLNAEKSSLKMISFSGLKTQFP